MIFTYGIGIGIGRGTGIQAFLVAKMAAPAASLTPYLIFLLYFNGIWTRWHSDIRIQCIKMVMRMKYVVNFVSIIVQYHMLNELLFWWNNFIRKWNIIYRYMFKNIWSWSWLLYDNDFMMIEIGQVRMKYHVHGMTIGQWMKYLWIRNAHFLSFLSHFSSFFLSLSSFFLIFSLFLFLPHIFFFAFLIF